MADHPYRALEDGPLWAAVADALTELERNNDLTLHTARELVIGYLCERLSNRAVGASLFQQDVK
jgi:hypothetical protein